MIEPINGHILVKPKKVESLLPTDKPTYEEIGEVVSVSNLEGFSKTIGDIPQIGDLVFYDSWLCAKYPAGTDDEFITLVPFKDVRAIQRKNAVEN